ncbi:MAG: DUF6580 family putative transport protein [Saprospiraceae bacterium]
MKNQNYIVSTFFIVFAAATRLVPHIDNFSGMEALALFGAAYYSRNYLALAMPLLVMYVVDFVINNTFARSFFPEVQGLVWWSDYMLFNSLAYALIAGFGIWVLKSKVRLPKLIASSLFASLLFFTVTNFGAWLSPASLFPATWSGLVSTYVAGVPFFKTSLVSTLVFSLIIFGSYSLFKQTFSNTLAIDK